MKKQLEIVTPLDEATVMSLHAGDTVLLNGVIWTGRDQAHKRLCAMLDKGEKLPMDLKDSCIYFTGPCPAAPGRVIGSAGPTTSYRMDAYSPRLLDRCGLRGMIGKGGRSQEVIDAIRRNHAVYLAATGGAGALIAGSVTACELVAFPDLGPEAIYRLKVCRMPLVVAIDCYGNSLYRKK